MGIHKFPGANGPLASSAGGGDNDGMEARITALEKIIPTLATKADVNELRLATKADMADLKTAFSESKIDLLKILLPTILALGAIAVAILLFAINRASPPQSARQPQPIVIQVPAATPATAPARKP